MAIHLACVTSFARIDMQEGLPALLVSAGVVFLAVPAVIRAQASHNRDSVPTWAKGTSLGMFAYACLACLVYLEGNPGNPERRGDDDFVLTIRGRVLSTISETDYWHHARYQVAFYFVILAALALLLAIELTVAVSRKLPSHGEKSA